MSKKYVNKRCVYCLEFFEKLEEEHVFPLSWYPDSMPDNIEKIKVPACKECNRKYKPIEEDLRLRIGLCLDPNNPSSSGIPERVIHSLDPDRGRNDKDREMRLKNKQAIIKKVIKPKNIPWQSVYPGFGLSPTANPEEQHAMPLPVNSLKIFAVKLVQGITYAQKGTYIEKDHKITIFPNDGRVGTDTINLIKSAGKHYDFSTALSIGVFSSDSDPQNGIFDILIWEKFRFFAFVTRDKT